MTKKATLSAETREETGSGPARRLRRNGYVPAVIYGHGQESRNLKVPERELRQLLESISVDNTLVDLRLEDGEGEDPEAGSRKVLIREVQQHPWKAQLLHVDFFQIREDEEIRVAIPIRYTGTPDGVRNAGGILQTNRNELEVECLPGEIPEYFELDVTELEIGDSLHVADLDTGAVQPLEELDLTLCVVVPPTVITVEEEEEAEEVELAELEPELVGEEEPEGEEPGEEEGPARELQEGESPEDLL